MTFQDHVLFLDSQSHALGQIAAQKPLVSFVRHVAVRVKHQQARCSGYECWLDGVFIMAKSLRATCGTCFKREVFRACSQVP